MSELFTEIAIYHRDLDPRDVSQFLSLEPCKSWRRGDMKGSRSSVSYEEGCWKSKTRKERSSLEKHLRILVERFQPRIQQLIQLKEQGYSIEFAVVISDSDTRPNLSISNESIAWLAKVGAAIDIDLY